MNIEHCIVDRTGKCYQIRMSTITALLKVFTNVVKYIGVQMFMYSHVVMLFNNITIVQGRGLLFMCSNSENVTKYILVKCVSATFFLHSSLVTIVNRNTICPGYTENNGKVLNIFVVLFS